MNIYEYKREMRSLHKAGFYRYSSEDNFDKNDISITYGELYIRCYTCSFCMFIY